MLDYLRCMKTHKNDSGLCRHLSKKYLECRMERYVGCHFPDDTGVETDPLALIHTAA